MEVIKICTLLDELFPNNAWYDISYQETSKAVHNWCNTNDAFYYADDRENFSIYVATRLAQEANKSKVVVEDLS